MRHELELEGETFADKEVEKLGRREQRGALCTTCGWLKIWFEEQIIYVDRVGYKNIVPPCMFVRLCILILQQLQF